MSEGREISREGLWSHMAEHFLDSETRHQIPMTALACLGSGLTLIELRGIWRHEVTPAVGINLWSPAGEWGAWEEEWLQERVEQCRGRRRSQPGFLDDLKYWVRVCFDDSYWCSIERCIQMLRRYESFVEQRQVAEDLRSLARIYLDFCDHFDEPMGAAKSHRLKRLFSDQFMLVFAPVFKDKVEVRAGNQRVEAILMAEGKSK